MLPKSLRCLRDIDDAASFVLAATRGKSAQQYAEDRLLRQAVERSLEIIGEALNRLAKADSGLAAAIEHHQQIIAFRNVLIHGYDLVDHARVWQVIQTDLPQLAAQVRNLLGTAE